MNEIEKAVIKSQLPKLEIDIGIFQHKETKEIRFCVMGVSTPLTKTKNMYIFDASIWERMNTKQLDGVERIQECYNKDLLKQMENKLKEVNKCLKD